MNAVVCRFKRQNRNCHYKSHFKIWNGNQINFCKMQQIPYLWVVTMGNGNIFFLKYVTNINRLSSVVYGRKDILFFSVALWKFHKVVRYFWQTVSLWTDTPWPYSASERYPVSVHKRKYVIFLCHDLSCQIMILPYSHSPRNLPLVCGRVRTEKNRKHSDGTKDTDTECIRIGKRLCCP